MKLGRKITVLGLSLLMVAAIGVSAVAASTTSDGTAAKIKAGVRGMFAGFHGGASDKSLETVASLTGLTADEIQTQLKAGKTLSEIAAAKNVSQDDLIAALVKEAQINLDTAKTDGKITQDQYDKMVANLKDRITKQVTETHPQRPGKGGMYGDPGKSMEVVASLTGLTFDEIQTQLKAGKTLSEIAAAKNVSQDDLIAALVKEAQTNLDTAKTDGKITQDQYDKMVANLKDRITKQVTEAHPQGPGRGKAFGDRGKSMEVVASLTGLTADEIQTQLKAGKTLSEIAAAKNVSQDDLIAALVKEAQTNLDTAKTDGKITEDQYTQCVSDLKEHITKQVTETRPEPQTGAGGPHGMGMRGDRYGMGDGPGQPTTTTNN